MQRVREYRHYAVVLILSVGLTVLFTDGASPVLGEESGGPRAVGPESETDGTPVQVNVDCVKGCDDVCDSGKKNDECGVCGGSGPGECGCDLNEKKDQCGVCGGNDSSCADCLGVPNGLAEDYGCGCGKPAPGPCGCDLEVKDLGCGCGQPAAGACGCDLSVKDLGCGCGQPAPGKCGCGLEVQDLGCGCGQPAPGACGCDLSVKDLGCGCGQAAPGKCGCTSCPPPPAQVDCPAMADTTCDTYGGGMETICVANPLVSASHKNNSTLLSFDLSTIPPELRAGRYIYDKGDGWSFLDVEQLKALYGSDYGYTSEWFSYDRAKVEAALQASLSAYSDYCFVCGCYRISGCFAPGSRIAMADGSVKPIEEIRAGDMVFNPVTGKPAAVERVIEGAESLPLIEYGYGVTLGRVSQKHPVLTALGMKRAAELTAADAVIGADGQAHRLAVVRRLAVEDGQMVLNLIINQESADPKDHMLLADDMVTGDFAAQSALSAK